MRRSPLLPRSPHSRHQVCSDFPSASPKTHEKALKSQMSPLTCAQIHSLAPFLPQSIPSNPRGISVHPAKISSSLGRHPRRSSLSGYPLTEAKRSPAVAWRRSAAAAGVMSCLFGSSAKASTGGEDFVRETVSSGDIVVFSKSYCPYCARVKSIFKDMNKDISVIELDEREDGQDIQDALGNFVGRRTVPQVFIKGEHIGGCDDTMEAYGSGRLEKLLAEV